ncbi:MAG: NAD(P)H-hydrate dehydratase [Omnitrophica WOR_2 bacterium GWA2_47_8]|nr:MAG: NAD(P)H-hydrate dehydratase [Omnitrophica WOR_2 bacterium GWA2_47_8]
MLGAAALTSLAAMRAGAGLVTVAVPKTLDPVLQKKISPVIMSLPLPETKNQSLALSALKILQRNISKFSALALGPGLSRDPSTRQLICKIIKKFSIPMVIDADALNALAKNVKILLKAKGVKILTPHPGEMTRLTGYSKQYIEKNRKEVACKFAQEFKCILLLKGHKTVVADPGGKVYVNTTGNAGLATAGSGDVLTGMITAFLAQGLNGFEAAKLGAYLHGKAADLAIRKIPKASLIATDIIDFLPQAIKSTK